MARTGWSAALRTALVTALVLVGLGRGASIARAQEPADTTARAPAPLPPAAPAPAGVPVIVPPAAAPTTAENAPVVAPGDTLVGAVRVGGVAGLQAPAAPGAPAAGATPGGAGQPGQAGAGSPADSAQADPLYQQLTSQPTPGQIVYRGQRLVLFPNERVIVLSGNARAEQDSTILTANRIAYARAENLIQAYGAANVQTGANSLASDSLVYDQSAGIVSTFGQSTLRESGREVKGENLQYSLDKKSGILATGRTEYDRWILRGQDMNKVGERTFLVQRGTFTTDPQEVPDYHFAARNIKLRQEDVIIAQPVILYVSDVPIFYIPWYLEPLGTGRKSGILRPNIGLNTLINANGEERNVQNLGYYWAISDFMDAQLALDWFSETRTIARLDYRYTLRYLLRGSAHLERVWNRNAQTEETLLRLNHDHEFDPSTNLRVDANIATSRQFFDDNSFDPKRLTQRALRSNAAFSRRFTWGNLTAGAFSDFQLQRERTDFKIPSLQLALNTRPLFPGSSLDRSWKQNLQISASTSFDFDYSIQGDSLTDRDSTVVNQQLSNTRGTLSGPFDLFGFINTTPSVSINQILFNNEVLPDSIVGASEESFGHLETIGAGLSFAASVFRVFQGGPGPVSKMRHTFAPSVSFSYQPATRPREELPLGFPGGGGVEVLNAFVNFTNNIDLKVRESRAQADRRTAEEDRIRRAREAGLLRPREQLTREEQVRLDSMAVADSLAALDAEAKENAEEAREDALEAGADSLPVPQDTDVVPAGPAAIPEEGAAAAGAAAPPGAPPPSPEDQFTERTVRLLSLRNRLGYDFVRARDERLIGFSTLGTDFSTEISQAIALNLSLNHTLVNSRILEGEGEGGGDVTEEFFDPFLSSVNTSVRFGGGEGNRSVRSFRFRDDQQEVTDAEAGQGGPPDGVGLGDPPQGFDAIQSSSLGRWEVDLVHSLSRQREAETRQSVRFETSFSPTENWHLRYGSGYDISEGKFLDQSVSLVRDLNRWQANLNFSVFPGDPQDRVLVQFAVYLRDIPDLRVPYRVTRE